MKLGSLFDGMGGFPLAATKHGITPVWASEIETFPINVTKRHFPNMKRLGDITQINGVEIDPVDIITFGSPCQDLSIAGNREGLGGERSGLFKSAIRIIRDMQKATNGKYPKFAVWENVPGAFSSNKGADFKTVLEEITEAEISMPKSGKWASAGMVRSNSVDVAWRVLDAQYWGVPQRRKRIFLVADFRGQRAAEILFKPESLPRYSAESTGQGEEITGSIAGSLDTASECLTMCFGPGGSSEIAHTLRAQASKADKPESTTYVVHPQITGTLCASGAGLSRPAGMASETDLVVAYSIAGNSIDRKIENGCNGQGVNKEVCFTLNTIDRHAVAHTGYAVRRLTPVECLRLQGLPDWWFDNIPGNSDTAKYKAAGNGMAQPCPDYVIAGMAEILKQDR